MLRPRELAERRAGKLDELRSILAAGDDVGDEARARFDALKAEIEALDGDLSRAEFLAAAEKRSAGSHAARDPLDAELAGYSVLRAIASTVPGLSVDAGRELEVSAELQRRSGRRHEGVSIPLAALERRTVTTAAPAGGPGGNLVRPTTGATCTSTPCGRVWSSAGLGRGPWAAWSATSRSRSWPSPRRARGLPRIRRCP